MELYTGITNSNAKTSVYTRECMDISGKMHIMCFTRESDESDLKKKKHIPPNLYICLDCSLNRNTMQFYCSFVYGAGEPTPCLCVAATMHTVHALDCSGYSLYNQTQCAKWNYQDSVCFDFWTSKFSKRHYWIQSSINISKLSGLQPLINGV